MKKSYLLSVILTTLLLWGFSNRSSATTYTINVTGSVNWETAGNWSPNGVPTASDDVIINNNSGSAVFVKINSNAACNNLTIDASPGSGHVYLLITAGNSLTVNGTTALTANPFSAYNAGVVLQGSATCTLTGAVTMGDGGLGNLGGGHALVNASSTGNLLDFGSTVNISDGVEQIHFASSTGTVNFSGTASQTIPVDGSNIYYDNITTNNSASVVLGNNITTSILNENLTVQSGTFDNGNYTITGNSSKTFEVDNGATFKLTGSAAFPTGFTTYTLQSTSTVDYDGTTQTIAVENYGNLTVGDASGTNTPTATMAGDLNTSTLLAGNLSVLSGTLDDGGYTIAGNSTTFEIDNGATFNLGESAFPSGFSTLTIQPTSTVNYDGTTTPQTVAAENYGNLSISGAKTINNVTLASSGNIGVSGIFDPSGASFTTGAFIITGSTIDYNGTSSQTVATGFDYNNLLINNTSTAGAALTGNLTATSLQGNLTVQTGTLDNGGYSIAGNSTTLEVDNGALLKLGGTSAFPSGFGTVTLQSASTVEYYGTSAQTIAAEQYGNLTISGSRGSNTITLASSGNIRIAGTFTPSATASTNFVTTGSTIDYDGTGAQTIVANAAPFSSYETLAVSGARTTNSVTLGSGTIDVTSAYDDSATFTTGNFVTSGNTVSFDGTTTTMAGCTSSPSFGALTISTGTLTSYSGNINVAGNFTNNGTFTPNGGTVTFDGTSTLSGSGTTSFNNLTIAASSALTGVSSGNFNVAGTWTNNGTYTHNSGTVTFDGSAAQTIGGSGTNAFYDVTINNSSGASPAVSFNGSGTASLEDLMTITAGNVDFTQTLTLLSTASNTAMIGPVPGTITGNITMERYVSTTSGSSGGEWRMLTAPVTGATIGGWNFFMTGFPGSDAPNYSPSVYTYSEFDLGTLNVGWNAPSGNSVEINPVDTLGRSFFVYEGPNPYTIKATGTPIVGNKNIYVSYNSTGSSADDGWNLVGNPYPCTIDWTSLYANSTGINGTYYFYDPSTGQYEGYNAASSSSYNGGNQYIPSSQGFWVQANAAGPTLPISESDKTTSHNPTYYKINSAYTFQKLRLQVTENSNQNTDETIIGFGSPATNQFDSQFDSYKLYPFSTTVPNISTVMNDSVDYTMNFLPSLSTTDTIPVRLKVGVSGTYTISRESTSTLPQSSCVMLEDKLTGTYTNLDSDTSSYTFTISDTTSAPRFVLIIGAPISTQSYAAACYGDSTGSATASAMGTGPFNYVWKNSTGAIVQSHTNVTGADTLKNVPAGTYTVDVGGSSGILCGSTSDTVTITQPAGMSPSIIATSGCHNGEGTITVNNISGGTAPYTYAWSNGDTTQNIANLSSGTYSLTVTDGSGCGQTFTSTVNPPQALQSMFTVSSDTVNLNQGGMISFTDGSTGASSYYWNFGDGATDTIANPSHTYTTVGTYNVTETIYNASCSDSSSQVVHVVNTTGIQNQTAENSIQVTSDHNGTFVSFNLTQMTDAVISVYNEMGQKVMNDIHVKAQNDKIQLNLSRQNSDGIYFVHVDTPTQSFNKKILVY